MCNIVQIIRFSLDNMTYRPSYMYQKVLFALGATDHAHVGVLVSFTVCRSTSQMWLNRLCAGKRQIGNTQRVTHREN